MENPTILVVDGDPKNLQIIKESLETAGLTVLTTDNGYEAWNMIQTHKPDIILSEVDIPGLNGFQLLEKLQEDPIGATIPLIFITNRRDLEDRIKSLRAGVKDYMIKPLHVKEVIARVQMILRRISRINIDEVESSKKIVGRLEENTLEELIEKFGVERKTGVLSLYDQNNRSGEIYFRDGGVVNATLGNFKAEKAVYQMLPWKKGHFIMTFKEINVEDDISVSNLGLLIQGFKRLEEREKLIKQLPHLDSILVKTAIFKQILKKRSITTDAFKFISLFDGKRTIPEIITDSPYDDLKTLEKTVKLYQQGFIKLSETPEQISKVPEKMPKPSPAPLESYVNEDDLSDIPKKDELDSRISPLSDKELVTVNESKTSANVENSSKSEDSQLPINEKGQAIAKIQPISTEDRPLQKDSINNGKVDHIDLQVPFSENEDLLNICDELCKNKNIELGHLAIIVPDLDDRKQLISILTGGRFSVKTIDSATGQAIELAKIQTRNEHTLEILGLSTEKQFLQIVEHLKDTLVGCIVATDGNDSSKMDYLGYLINFLVHSIKVPHIIAIYRKTDKIGLSLDFIRNALRVDEKEQLVEFDIQKFDSIIHLLLQLIARDNVKNIQTDLKNVVRDLVQTEK